MMIVLLKLAFLLLVLACAGLAADGPFQFRDVAESARLLQPLAGLMGHGGAWGDLDGDGHWDLFVGGFCDRPAAAYHPAPGPVPSRLLRNLGDGRFECGQSPRLFCAPFQPPVPQPAGNAFVYEYDTATRALRRVMDVRQVLALPEGHYTPGKIHSRLDLGSDGWLYCATHRGSPRVTTDEYHYRGDWILRYHPGRKTTEVLVAAPIPRHSIPASVLDSERMIFYGGTAPSIDREKEEGIRFFAYDARGRSVFILRARRAW
jgi:hypothetical protein